MQIFNTLTADFKRIHSDLFENGKFVKIIAEAFESELRKLDSFLNIEWSVISSWSSYFVIEDPKKSSSFDTATLENIYIDRCLSGTIERLEDSLNKMIEQNGPYN